MKLEFKEAFATIKRIINHMLFVVAVAGGITVGFLVGINYNKIVPQPKTKIKYVNKKDVNIAIDEGNRLVLIDNFSGDYVIYSDSVGKSIFNSYANQIMTKNEP
jgi:hypothetical protein